MSVSHQRAAAVGLAGCHTCGKVSPLSLGRCPRCGSHLHLRKSRSVERTVAFMLAATALYIPANVLPMMTMVELGESTSNTITGGIAYFWKGGAYPIALVILTASILIPLLKMVALTWLCLAATGKLHPSPGLLGKIYWVTELMGRWSMVDIFVVGILVALVQVGNYMTVTPGPGALAFAGVVVLTMFAAMSFDPRLLWDRLEALQNDPATSNHVDP
ncbi:MAG: paraquat-inducible protein A [Akkermansiaceae bacterium]|jgi:paraquat-inducible protein A|nr:paraquat-inducible protein A [Akkermansiaceae bacterium]